MKNAALTLFLIIPFLALIMPAAIPQKKKPSYIGSSQCKKCHSAEAIGNQYSKWQNSPHSKAYRELRTEKGAIIAEKFGIKNPSENSRCLKCHTTGGGENSQIVAEGVGCESCHGPASEYSDLINHGSLGDKQKDYERGVSSGMYRIIGYDGIKLRERMCRRCHTPDRPCTPDDPAEKRRKELSLPTIADFIYKHPLR